jgi:cytochrome c oxidase subunit II
MGGWIEVMTPQDFQNWLDSERLSKPMRASGKELFEQFGCSSCHSQENTGRGPALRNLYRRQVPLQGTGSAIADESYMRESILNPNAKVVRGYASIMPTYQGQIGDEQLNELIEYLKSLKR